MPMFKVRVLEVVVGWRIWSGPSAGLCVVVLRYEHAHQSDDGLPAADIPLRGHSSVRPITADLCITRFVLP